MSDFVRLDRLWLEGQRSEARRPRVWTSWPPSRRRAGWFTAGGLGIGLKWWWQLYPKGFEISKRVGSGSRSSRTARARRTLHGRRQDS